MRAIGIHHPSPLPGFRLAFGIAMTMLSIVVLIPIGALILRGAGIGPAALWQAIATERVWAALRLSFGVALLASLFNLVFGLALAWVLTRYRFPLRRLVDAAVDLPFALPTAVAGIALTALYAPNGAFGQLLAPLGHQGRLHPARHLGGAGLHRPAVRGAHRAAGDRGARARARGGLGDARRQPRPHLRAR